MSKTSELYNRKIKQGGHKASMPTSDQKKHSKNTLKHFPSIATQMTK